MEQFDFSKVESLGYKSFTLLSAMKWLTDDVMIAVSPREDNDIYFMRINFRSGKSFHSVLISSWLRIEDFGKFEELLMSLHNDPDRTESDFISSEKLANLKRIFKQNNLVK